MDEETRRAHEFEDLQSSIYQDFSKTPESPVLSLKSVTQTSAIIQWQPLELYAADLRGIDVYKNGQKVVTTLSLSYTHPLPSPSSASTPTATSPSHHNNNSSNNSNNNSNFNSGNNNNNNNNNNNTSHNHTISSSSPLNLQSTCTKLSGLDVSHEYQVWIVVRTSAGTFESNHIAVKTLPLTDLTGLNICFGPLSGSSVEREALEELVVKRLGAKCGDELSMETTHVVCSFARGPKYEKAVEWNVPVVSPEFLRACEQSGKMVNIIMMMMMSIYFLYNF